MHEAHKLYSHACNVGAGNYFLALLLVEVVYALSVHSVAVVEEAGTAGLERNEVDLEENVCHLNGNIGNVLLHHLWKPLA